MISSLKFVTNGPSIFRMEWIHVYLLYILVIMEISPIVSVKITSQDAIIGDEMEKDTHLPAPQMPDLFLERFS